MTGIPQLPTPSQADEIALRTMFLRQINGVYTSASRTDIPDDKAYNIENMIPVGEGNLNTVPGTSASLMDYTAHPIYWSQGVNLNGSEKLVNFSSDGTVFIYDVVTNTQVTITTLLSGNNSRCTQWSNTIILFIDATGYYSYDGTNFTKITGSGVPSSGNDIAVYSGRVFIASGRTLFLSGPADYTAASWLPSNGAAFISLTDPSVRSTIQRMTVSNGLLYALHTAGVNAISNIQVPIGTVPPTPSLINSPIQNIIGTDQPASVVPFDRYAIFANRYGAYMLFGISAPKLSDDINGTWQYLDFSQTISAGQVVVRGIICAAFLVKRLNDPIFGSNTVLAMWHRRGDQDIWWFGNFGAVTFIATSFINNQPVLFGFIGNKMYQLFGNPASFPAVKLSTKLWPMEDPLARKEVLQVGLLMNVLNFGSSIGLNVDSNTLSLPVAITVAASQGLWVNSGGVTGFWINTAHVQGGWTGIGSFLVSGFSTAPMFDHNVGITMTAVGYNMTISYLAMDYKLRERWL